MQAVKGTLGRIALARSRTCQALLVAVKHLQRQAMGRRSRISVNFQK